MFLLLWFKIMEAFTNDADIYYLEIPDTQTH